MRVYTDLVTCANAWDILKRSGLNDPERMTLGGLLDNLLSMGMLADLVAVITHNEVDANALGSLREVTEILSAFFADLAGALPGMPMMLEMLTRIKTHTSPSSPTSAASDPSPSTNCNQEPPLSSETSS